MYSHKTTMSPVHSPRAHGSFGKRFATATGPLTTTCSGRCRMKRYMSVVCCGLAVLVLVLAGEASANPIDPNREWPKSVRIQDPTASAQVQADLNPYRGSRVVRAKLYILSRPAFKDDPDDGRVESGLHQDVTLYAELEKDGKRTTAYFHFGFFGSLKKTQEQTQAILAKPDAERKKHIDAEADIRPDLFTAVYLKLVEGNLAARQLFANGTFYYDLAGYQSKGLQGISVPLLGLLPDFYGLVDNRVSSSLVRLGNLFTGRHGVNCNDLAQWLYARALTASSPVFANKSSGVTFFRTVQRGKGLIDRLNGQDRFTFRYHEGQSRCQAYAFDTQKRIIRAKQNGDTVLAELAHADDIIGNPNLDLLSIFADPARDRTGTNDVWVNTAGKGWPVPRGVEGIVYTIRTHGQGKGRQTAGNFHYISGHMGVLCRLEFPAADAGQGAAPGPDVWLASSAPTPGPATVASPGSTEISAIDGDGVELTSAEPTNDGVRDQSSDDQIFEDMLQEIRATAVEIGFVDTAPSANDPATPAPCTWPLRNAAALDTDGDGVNDTCGLDLNDDNQVDDGDTQMVSQQLGLCLGDPGFDPAVDLDGDGCTDATDVELMAPAIPPDLGETIDSSVPGTQPETCDTSCDGQPLGTDAHPTAVPRAAECVTAADDGLPCAASEPDGTLQ